MSNLLFILFTGIGATAVMDLWGIVRKPLLGIPLPNYGMVGRWLAHMTHGQFRHDSIAISSSIRGEHIIGWTAHYLTGIGFAALLIGIWGESWVHNPTISPALAVGIGTVAAPFLLMQPGMGAGIAASRTQHPASARLQSLITHAVFGLGLYASGRAIQLFYSI
ncbi:DUF2938 domain-containing protein [Oceanisphaera sp. KMM 10153]|uniref:DUF2938 domain-containing protein n=1 Tax=Oceanisphaera submarina TaxID=3390193 RepID=UPI003976A69D